MPPAPAALRLLMTLTLATATLFAPSLRAASGLGRLVMPGPVTQAHVKQESDCDGCHVSFDKSAQAKVCLACHDKVAADVREQRGFHGRQADPQCRSCHTEHKGREANIAAFDFARFDHANTDFALLGKHIGPYCNDCHRDGKKFRDAPGKCESCHAGDDAHGGRLGQDCAQCHDSNGWSVRNFDHSRTAFKLAGKHLQARCTDCHTQSYKTQRLSDSCVSCHRRDDRHRGSLGEDCRQCHQDSGWRDTRFDHRATGFALLGRHADTACAKCHRETGNYKGAATTCIGCHRDDDRHGNTLGAACESCHSPLAWKPSSGFDHALTKFPLLGKHQTTRCSDCHADATHFRATGRDCVSCHRQDDKHKGRNGDNCADCHASDDWKRTRFDHDKQTSFALVGAHKAANCEACHHGDVHKDKPPTTCNGCHQEKDPHRGKLGANCTDCHDTQAWKPAHFDHDKVSFVLLGAHRAVACAKCHATALYRDTAHSCNGCHAGNDAHRGALGVECASCHNTRDWRLGEFDHRKTDFLLDGAHARVACNQCHREGAAGAPRIAADCASCHGGDDIHEGAFGRQCERCHVTESFRQVTHSRAGGDR